MKTQLIVALDNLQTHEVSSLVDELSDHGIQWFKVGLELFVKEGPSLLKKLKSKNHKIFLDLKLFDIPNTVSQAVKAAAEYNVDLLTIHCAGGIEMMEAASKAAEKTSLNVLGVTVLTSFDDATNAQIARAWTSQGNVATRSKTVEAFAKLAHDANLSGIVCSVPDLKMNPSLKTMFGHKGANIVTPGIRNAGDAKNDQKNVATAKDAIHAGATHLVVGRPILQPTNGDRRSTVKQFLTEMDL